MLKIVALTGAGISAESGIQTFRDQDGLWEGHDVQKVATPQGWQLNPSLVLKFYNDRRRQLKEVLPNDAHIALADLEQHFNVHVVTQNVDDLHERGGSSRVIHLHGELLKVRSLGHDQTPLPWTEDIGLGDLCDQGFQLRPHIVWFGEEVPMLGVAARLISEADIVIIVGTSMMVYPAASLVGYAPEYAKVYYINPDKVSSEEFKYIKNFKYIQENATTGLKKLATELKALL